MRRPAPPRTAHRRKRKGKSQIKKTSAWITDVYRVNRVRRANNIINASRVDRGNNVFRVSRVRRVNRANFEKIQVVYVV